MTHDFLAGANSRFICVVLLCCAVIAPPTWIGAAEKPPAVGDMAADFELNSLGDEKVTLAKLVEAGPVVLVVLRGYPGYQCPLCTKQFGEFLNLAEEFKKHHASVVFVYPGPSEKLQQRAEEFVKGKDYPDNFQILLDPDYRFTNAYGLRWNANAETAYPSTFVIDSKQKILFELVSKTHGGRAKADAVLQLLAAH